MNKYLSRITSSARGEVFNPLLWPFLLATFAYGVGFAFVLPFTDVAGTSSLYTSMSEIGRYIPMFWGVAAVLNIIGGLTFLLFNIPPFGKATGLVGFTLWSFAAMCYILTGDWLPLLSVAVPNGIFWIWQYLSLGVFRREDEADLKTIRRFNRGDFD